MSLSPGEFVCVHNFLGSIKADADQLWSMLISLKEKSVTEKIQSVERK